MTLAVKVALNPNTTNQPTKNLSSGNGLKPEIALTKGSVVVHQR